MSLESGHREAADGESVLVAMSGGVDSSLAAAILVERGFRIVEALERVAQQHDMTPAKIALAWLISQPTITAPIASATNLNQLNELIEAATIELNPSVIDQLNQASV